MSALAAARNVSLASLLSKSDSYSSWPDQPNSADTLNVPFLLQVSRPPPRDSRKAQLILGIIPDSVDARAGRNVVQIYHDEEDDWEDVGMEGINEREALLGAAERDMDEQDDEQENEYWGKENRCGSLKAQVMLGLAAEKELIIVRNEMARKSKKSKSKSKRRTRSRISQVESTATDSSLALSTPTIGGTTPFSFAAHRAQHYDTADREPTNSKRKRKSKPPPLSFSMSTRVPRDRSSARLLSSAGSRYSASNAVNFSRPLSLASPGSLNTVPAEYLEDKRSPVIVTLQASTPKESVGRRAPVIRQVMKADLGLPSTPSGNTLALAQPIFSQAAPRSNMSQRHAKANGSSFWTGFAICPIRIGGKSPPSSKPNRLHKREKSYRDDPKEKRSEEKQPLMATTTIQVEWEPENLPHVPTSPLQLSVNDFKYAESSPRSSRSKPKRKDKGKGKATRAHLQDRSPPIVVPVRHMWSLSSPAQDMLSPCVGCGDSKPPDAFPIRQCSVKCTHPPHTCKACIEQSLDTTIDEHGKDGCACPECGEKMAHDDVRFFASEEAFEKFESLSTRSTLSKLDAFFWCVSPTCDSGQIQPQPVADNPTFVCGGCGHTYCLNHPDLPFHAGLSCPEFDALLANERRAGETAGAAAAAAADGTTSPETANPW